MRNTIFLLTGVLFILFSCTTNTNDFVEKTEQNNQNHYNKSSGVLATFADSPKTSLTPLNEIIVEYLPSTTEVEKQVLRTKYNVVSTENCGCIDDNSVYELWIMDSGINAEPTAKIINQDPDENLKNAAPNFMFNVPMHKVVALGGGSEDDDVYIQSVFNSNYVNRRVSSNNGITVAVLDTGIDTDQQGFIGSFLYNSAGNIGCGDISGWDFVDKDNNTYDDDINKHGTVVSYVIHKELTERGIGHQILPVKTIDKKGNSTFFDTFCGLKYAIERDADVINMSFGWTGYNEEVNELFANLIATTKTTFVASAGNRNEDNDILPHYPSNFQNNNLISVAASKFEQADAAGYTNYGENTVDFYAIGNKISFPLTTPNTFINFKGTSFAAPLVSARVAELLSYNVEEIKYGLNVQFGVQINYPSKPVFYMTHID